MILNYTILYYTILYDTGIIFYRIMSYHIILYYMIVWVCSLIFCSSCSMYQWSSMAFHERSHSKKNCCKKFVSLRARDAHQEQCNRWSNAKQRCKANPQHGPTVQRSGAALPGEPALATTHCLPLNKLRVVTCLPSAAISELYSLKPWQSPYSIVSPSWEDGPDSPYHRATWTLHAWHKSAREHDSLQRWFRKWRHLIVSQLRKLACMYLKSYVA